MRYSDECPPPWEARRAGEQAGHRGWGSNPYREQLGELHCEDAESAWRRGYYAGEERRQEEEHEERMVQLRAEQATAARAEEEARWEAFRAEEAAYWEAVEQARWDAVAVEQEEQEHGSST